MKAIPVSEAVGMVLGHDVTRIVPGGEKGPAFRKGHVIQAADIPAFLDIGKAHVHALQLTPGRVHEDEAARRIATASDGPGLRLTDPREGRVNLIAETRGLLKIDTDALFRLNRLGQIAFATIHANRPVNSGQPVAGTRIIPLVIQFRRSRNLMVPRMSRSMGTGSLSKPSTSSVLLLPASLCAWST